MVKQKVTSYKTVLYFAIIYLLIPILNVVLIEGIQRASFAAFFDWAKENTAYFIFTFLFMVFLIGIGYILPRALFYLFVVLQTILWTIISFGSYQKF